MWVGRSGTPTETMPPFGETGWQNCDESHRFAVDRLLIKPTHGHQAAAGDNERTNHSQGIPNGSQSPEESRPLPPPTSLPISTPDRRN